MMYQQRSLQDNEQAYLVDLYAGEHSWGYCILRRASVSCHKKSCVMLLGILSETSLVQPQADQNKFAAQPPGGQTPLPGMSKATSLIAQQAVPAVATGGPHLASHHPAAAQPGVPGGASQAPALGSPNVRRSPRHSTGQKQESCSPAAVSKQTTSHNTSGKR